MFDDLVFWLVWSNQITFLTSPMQFRQMVELEIFIYKGDGMGG